MRKVRAWCREYGIMFKINSVINAYNVDEDMRENIEELDPVRWKVFQCKKREGENYGEGALRQVEKFLISDDQFKDFLERHADVPQIVPEYSEMMVRSYFIVDEYFRFIDNGADTTSQSILDIGVEAAIKDSGFVEKKYLDRGGRYDWSKKPVCADKDLSW